MKKITTASCEEMLVRLNKFIAHSGIASRRAADAMIAEGRVLVNGVIVVEPGTRVSPERDAVVVDGAPLAVKAVHKKTYLLCNKPIRVVSTAKDPQGRETVLDMLPPEFADKRLYPVGRLDYFSEGLLLLTNDGELTLRLTHPRYHLPKTYRVTVRETPSPTALETMRRGMTLAEGEKLAPVQVRVAPGINERQRETVLEMVLNQGVNRQIRRMCRDLNLTILRLQRVSSGPLHLGDLAPGKVRELSAGEIAQLRHAVKLPADFHPEKKR